MRRIWMGLAVVTMVAAACAAGDQDPAGPSGAVSTTTTTAGAATVPGGVPTTTTVTLDVDGEERTYVLFVPQGISGGPVPLVVDLHGLSESADEEEQRSGMRLEAAEEGFVVVQPEGRSALKYWESSAAGTAVTGDVAFIRAVVDDVASTLDIDPRRVYAVGLSNGGGMANRLACEAADVFAAVAPVAGAHTQHTICEPIRPVPVVIFHGDADPVVPYSGVGELFPPIDDYAAGWAERNGCDPEPGESRVATDVIVRSWPGCEAGADVVLYIIEGGGHGWPDSEKPTIETNSTQSISATEVMWDFFKAHPLS